jgi:hypothetical protein
MKDETVEALEDCISNLTAIANSGQSIYPHYVYECRRKAKTLTALRDSLAARPIVGEVEGKPVRLGDVLVQPFKFPSGTPANSFRMVCVDGTGLPKDWHTGAAIQWDRCRLPTAADFGGKQ